MYRAVAEENLLVIVVDLLAVLLVVALAAVTVAHVLVLVLVLALLVVIVLSQDLVLAPEADHLSVVLTLRMRTWLLMFPSRMKTCLLKKRRVIVHLAAPEAPVVIVPKVIEIKERKKKK